MTEDNAKNMATADNGQQQESTNAPPHIVLVYLVNYIHIFPMSVALRPVEDQFSTSSDQNWLRPVFQL
jgi:hypothetical protein